MSKDSSAKQYQENKERLQKKLVKNKKRQYGHERYKNLSEYEKQKLVEHRKQYCKIRKMVLL